MGREIVISDDVYRRLCPEKGDRSVSEVIADRLESRRSLADVSGQGIFDPGKIDNVNDDIESLSDGTTDR